MNAGTEDRLKVRGYSATTTGSITVQLRTEYGCGGEYQDISSYPPNCFGYAVFVEKDIGISFGLFATSHLTADNKGYFENALRNYVTSYRQIDNYQSPIETDEYRIAVRIPNGIVVGNELSYFHVIYQLSNGQWAGKDYKEPSDRFDNENPSITPKMWNGDSYYPQSCGTIYYAVKNDHPWQRT